MSKEYYKKPLVVTYSGGKDSDVMLHLAETTLKPSEFEVLNSHTTVDAPETVYHIRKTFERLRRYGVNTNIDYHIQDSGKPITMWNLIPQKLMPPTRIVRYCCAVLKESGASNRIACLGVREEESNKRAGRDMFSVRKNTQNGYIYFSLDHTQEVHREANVNDPVWDCTLIKTMREHGSTTVSPIYYWSNSDIWDYITNNHIETNPLYKCGYERVGCIGCPLAGYRHRIKEFNDFPKYKKLYIMAFSKMLERLKEREGFAPIKWTSPQDVFDWWMEEHKHNVKGQMTIDDWLKESEVT